MGAEIKTLVSENQNAGMKSVIWDGTNDFGHTVAAGIYVYKLQTDNSINSNKMLFLK